MAVSMNRVLNIYVKRLTPTAKLPTKSYQGDSGWDLYADVPYIEHNGKKIPNLLTPVWIIPPGKSVIISIGIAVQLPKGWGAKNWPRSSQGVKNVHVYGGVIDNGYRGELHVTVHNSNPFTISYRPGDRVAQMVLTPVPKSRIKEVKTLSETQRGEKRFGSTGR